MATGGQRGMTGEDLRALLTNGTEGGQSSGQLPSISVVSLWGEGSRFSVGRGQLEISLPLFPHLGAPSLSTH